LIVRRRGGVQMLLSQVNVIHENHFLLFLMSLFLCCLSGYVIIVKKEVQESCGTVALAVQVLILIHVCLYMP